MGDVNKGTKARSGTDSPVPETPAEGTRSSALDPHGQPRKYPKQGKSADLLTLVLFWLGIYVFFFVRLLNELRAGCSAIDLYSFVYLSQYTHSA